MTNTEKLIKFYGTCLEKGYSNMSDDKESLKAKVIATDLGIKYKNIAETYAEAKILYEKDIITKENEAIRQKNEEERRKVDGSLILTVHENESGRGKIITVYRRPDKSIYCCLNGSPRKLEGITISAEKSATIQVKHNPSKLVYTGASSGGITMGGVHATQATYSESAYYTGNGTVQVALEDGTSFIVQKIDVAPAICELFKRDKEFKSFINSSNSIMCYNGLKRSSVEFATKAIMNSSHSYVDKNAMLSTALDDLHLKYSICADISRLINKILSGYNPPSDEELYYSAIRKIKSDNKDELKDAISILTDIADYSDAKEKRVIAQEKLDDIIQTEKENAILAKEAAEKRRKKNMPIYICCAVLVCALIGFFVYYSSVIKPQKDMERQYKNAVAMFDGGQYKEAKEQFSILGDYEDANEMIKKCDEEIEEQQRSDNYEKALNALSENKFDEAIRLFTNLENYKDSAEKLEEALVGQAIEEKNNERAECLESYQKIIKDYTDGKEVELFGILDAIKSLGNNYNFTELDCQEIIDTYNEIVAVINSISGDYTGGEISVLSKNGERKLRINNGAARMWIKGWSRSKNGVEWDVEGEIVVAVKDGKAVSATINYFHKKAHSAKLTFMNDTIVVSDDSYGEGTYIKEE